MLDQVLDVFNIVPNTDLNMMKTGQSLTEITTTVMTQVGEVIAKVTPDIVLVQGDTTTAMATAMASFYANVEIGHVEAGLRTFDLNPLPLRSSIGKLSENWLTGTFRQRYRA